MIDELRAMAIFAETAEKGSFRLAAQSLGLSPSVVSYHISRLEKSLDTPLLYRTTRSLSLTHEGQLLYQRAAQMLTTARTGLEEISSGRQELQGKLVITLPTALTHHEITIKIADFVAHHKGLDVRLVFTDQRQDLVDQSIDLAIRAGEMPDSTLKSKKLGSLQRKLVANTELFRTYGEPQSPFEVQSWPWVHLMPMQQKRQIIDPEGNFHHLEFAPAISVNTVEAMSQLCIQGLGVATPPVHLIDSALQQGLLKEICPNWKVMAIPLYAVWPNNKAIHKGVKTLLDHIQNIN